MKSSVLHLSRARRRAIVRLVFLVTLAASSVLLLPLFEAANSATPTLVLAPVLSERLAGSRTAGRGTQLAVPDQSIKTRVADEYGKLPLRFEANEGQTDQQVKFLSRGPGYDLFLTAGGAVLTLRKPQPQIDKFAPPGSPQPLSTASAQQASVLRLKMVGANPKADVEGQDELPGKVNYFIGDDQDKWHTDIPTYLKVHYAEIYPGVDLVYYGNRTELEYDFVVTPGGHLQAIKFQFEGADRISLDDAGNLHLAVKQDEVRLRKPLIYQLTDEGDRREVKGEYVIKGKTVGFKVKSFDSRKPLIIDPVLSYSTLLGAGGNEYAYGIAVDAQGNAYVTGTTDFSIFPTTPGAFQPVNQAGGAFVSKLDATGTSLIYSTYLNGNSNATGTGIAVDSSGDAFVTGYTSSADFPTVNPIRGGRSNLLKTTDSGSHWVAGNIGLLNRPVQTLAIDKVTPTTIYAGMGSGAGIYKTTDGGANWTALNTGVTNPSCSALVIDPSAPATIYAALTTSDFSVRGVYKSTDGGTTWSSANAGLGSSGVSALGIDPQNPSTLYAGGSQFGFYKSTNGGASWVLANTGFNFGGTFSIVVDPVNSAIVYASAGGGGVFKTTNGAASWSQFNTGLTNTTVRTLSIDPTPISTLYAGTAGGGVFKTTNGGGNWTPINNGLPANASVVSSVLNPGSPATIYIGTNTGGIFKTVDGGNTWTKVFETITSTHFNAVVIDPISPTNVYFGADSAAQSMLDSEVFVAKLNPAGSALIYSTLLGGGGDDYGWGIALDSSGAAYVTGETRSSSFPAINANQPTFGGPDGCADGFLTKLNAAGSALQFSTFLGGSGCDVANAVAVDTAGNAYVTGTTSSTNFPIANAFQSTLVGPFSDAFATKFSSGGALVYSTYLGGSNGTDTGYGIAADSSGNAYITGVTASSNFPTANPIQATNGGSPGDVFVTKLNNLGSGLVYSTYLGGSSSDVGRGIAVDSAGNAYVAGFTSSGDFPVITGALRTKSPLFKSSDSGGSWSNDNYGLKSDWVTTLALDPTKPSTIYAGTRGGVFKSTDGGRVWNSSSAGLVQPFVVGVVVNPVSPSTIYLAAALSSGNSAGVYQSTDGGNNWNAVNNGLGNGGVSCLAIDRVTPTTLYAGSGSGIFKSVNGGSSWIPAGLSTSSVAAIAIDPVTPSTVYAAVNSSSGGVFKSIDGGANWQAVNNGLTSPIKVRLAIDPVIPTTIYAGGDDGLFKSVNGASSWIAVNTGLTGQFITAIAIDPVTPTTLYAASNGSGGVFKSVNGGNNWSPMSNGLRYTVSSVIINPTNTSTLYAGVQVFPPDDDAFVSKLSPAGSALVYSTLIGGTPATNDSLNFNDDGFAIALDPTGNAYVAGLSRSPDFPVTSDSFQPFNRGFTDAFVAKLTASYIISGQVLDGSSAPVSGAEITLSDGVSLSSIVTESDGAYQFSHLREGGNFTVSAAKPHFTMAPTSQSFSNLTSNQTVNFIATATNAAFYTINGQVTNNASGLGGVTVTLSGSQPGLRTTDSNGNYSFTLAGGGNYTITPALLGFTFIPPNRTFNNLSADQTGDFIATRQNFVVTNANDHGTGSLRQAILDANATVGTDTIVFNIPGAGVQTINLFTSLPTITDPVVIDASTQPGYAGAPLVELNGASAGSGGNGLAITAGGCTIRGFVINRFNNAGISLSTNGNNVIQGNYIGIDPTGTLRRANNTGIIIGSSSNNTIGGTTAATRNVISGNGLMGISLSGSGTQITGNFIGTNAAGTAALSNGSGVEIFNFSNPPSPNNVIGGTSFGAGNLISGNQTGGIVTHSPGLLIQGNLIGTDVTGTIAIGNNTGISAAFPNTVIGGTVPGARNVISGNVGIGVEFRGSGSLLQGNFIGTDISGTKALGNGASGVVTSNGVLIGGTTPSARNVISCNGFPGNVTLQSNSSGGSPSVVQGNYIGTDVTGNVALSNPVAGISLAGSSNLIGGLAPGAQNVISGNQVGINIDNSISQDSTGNIIQGNIIGLNALGTLPLPNVLEGIRVTESLNNTIGGTANGASNKIAFNGWVGVNVISGTGNSIQGNSIFSNGSLGIDLGSNSVTGNDSGDADSGANKLQNFPVLTSVSSNGGNTTIQGQLNSTSNTTFRIDFYSNAACDPSGNGEGAIFFDTTSITTDGSGNAAINFTSLAALASGRVITATATDPAGNTSEFSKCDSTNATGSVQFSLASYYVLEDVGNALITVVRTGGSKGALSVNYSMADVTATAPSDYTASSGTLTFADGETSKTIVIPIANDGISEPDETVRLSLTAADLETLSSPSVATLTILDNNTPLSLLMIDVDIPEGNSGTTNALVTVILSAGTGRTVTANFTTTPIGSAISGVDFTPVSGTLTFSPGITTQTISVPIIGDTLNEGNEVFEVDLSNPTNATVANSATVRILNDDPLPSISIADTSVSEGNSGTVNAVFNVSLSVPSGRTVTAFFNTASGTATAGSDYVTTSGSVIFSAGETLKTISVPVNGDTSVEPDETFFVNITSAPNAAVVRSQGVGRILNDDGVGSTISLSQANYIVGESDGQLTITVNRTGDTSGPATVDYATSDAGAPCVNPNHLASSRCDFTTALGTLRFAGGDTSKTFIVLINQDSFVEGVESFTVSLSNLTGSAAFGAVSTATITINDDATEPPTNSIDDAASFVRQHYHDFLNREPDAGGLGFWTNEITSCGSDQQCTEVKRINVSAAFYLSIEFQGTGYLVERFYKTAYGDATGNSTFPTPHQLPVPIVRFNEFLSDTQEIGQGVVVGQTGWETVLENNKQAFTAEFAQRPRFTTAFPTNMTALDFVNKLNLNAGNPLSPAERDQLVNDLSTSAKTRAQVLRMVAEHQNLVNAEFNRAFVLMQFFGYLRRNPNDPQDTDYSGYDFWLTKLNNFTVPGDDPLARAQKAEMVKAFIVSTEYRQRFGP